MYLGREILENSQVKGDVTWQSAVPEKSRKKNWQTPRLNCFNLMAENWI